MYMCISLLRMKGITNCFCSFFFNLCHVKCYQTPTCCLGAKRQLAQSMSRELGPKGLHIAHIIVDGIIETPFHASDASPVPRDVWHRRLPNDGIIDPENIAEAFLFLSKQKKNAWTFEMDLRPWDEQW